MILNLKKNIFFLFSEGCRCSKAECAGNISLRELIASLLFNCFALLSSLSLVGQSDDLSQSLALVLRQMSSELLIPSRVAGLHRSKHLSEYVVFIHRTILIIKRSCICLQACFFARVIFIIIVVIVIIFFIFNGGIDFKTRSNSSFVNFLL